MNFFIIVVSDTRYDTRYDNYGLVCYCPAALRAVNVGAHV
ncbi:hypothetical protein OROMI_029569 [Orobanche minor]